MENVARPPSRLRNWLLPAAALVLAAALVRAQGQGPPDPGQSRYGTNWPGDLRLVLIEAAIELAVLLIILQPWSYARSAVRAVCACVVFLIWTFMALAVGMHGGPIIGAHILWLMLMTIGLMVLVCVSGVARWRGRRRRARSGRGLFAAPR
jgi:hypothetical protein